MTDDQAFWLIVRMALIQFVKAIEKHKLHMCKGDTAPVVLLVDVTTQAEQENSGGMGVLAQNGAKAE